MGTVFNIFKKNRKNKKKESEADSDALRPVLLISDGIQNHDLSNDIANAVKTEDKVIQEQVPSIDTNLGMKTHDEIKDDTILDADEILSQEEEDRITNLKDIMKHSDESLTWHEDENTQSSETQDDDESLAHLWRFIGCAPTPKIRSTFSVMRDDESTIRSFYTRESSSNINSSKSVTKSAFQSLIRQKQKTDDDSNDSFWNRIWCGSPSTATQ